MVSAAPIHPLKLRLLHKPRFVPLRVRFMLLTTLMLTVVLGLLAFFMGLQQRITIRKQLEQRGLAVANSLAASSLTHLMTYNYVAMESSAQQAAQDPDISYVIFHDKEGRVAGYSGRPDLQNTKLDDEVSKRALESAAPLTQESHDRSGAFVGLDASVPVFPPGVNERWGTVRVGLSLATMYRQIRELQWIIVAIGAVALVCGVLFSLGMARRITKPLGNLAAGTQAVARGDLAQEIDVQTGDEVEVLAASFKTMIEEIVAHRKQLENRLAEIQRLQRYTERLLITMNDGLLSVDMNGRISTINPAAGRLLSVAEHRPAAGDDIAEALREFPELMAYLNEIGSAPCDRPPREIHLEGTGGDKDEVLLVGCGLLKDSGGQPQEVILNLHDITELKRLEASMRQAERLAALGTLGAGMAHEIRNPLSAIKTFVQLLPRKISKPGFLDKFQRTVPRELERINQLVEDLLELARKPDYHFEPVDLPQLILHHLNLLEEELRQRRVECLCNFQEDLPLMRLDGRQMSKAIHNLILNAAQAMPTGGVLTIDVGRGQNNGGDYETVNDDARSFEWMTAVFSDTGPGIAAEELKNIFNPFFTTKDCGTGLGLSITHKVIAEHGGKIDVQSRPGEGATFIVKLPVRGVSVESAFPAPLRFPAEQS